MGNALSTRYGGTEAATSRGFFIANYLLHSL